MTVTEKAKSDNLIIKCKSMESIKYDFYENPNNGDEKSRSKYHIRICNRQKLSTRSLVKRLTKSSTLTPIDISAALVGIQDAVAEGLSEGNIVVLDGICQFEISLTTKNGMVTGLENGNNVVLKSVNIRPLPEFVNMVAESLKPRVKSRGYHSVKLSDIEIEGKLTDFFEENESITRKQAEYFLDINKNRTIAILKKFVAEGKLKNIGHDRFPKYVPVPGFFGFSKKRK